ncbi:LysM peptidoglycan-binding domain-containing protein [Pseudonocardia asaccharolytica]|uniref:Transglycosylase n=1 Tax=Pseudonocardia asaccharolytica DSM 44247 = NBRC 16224 TaxID=1123024 RepID=A0A511D6T2_9PSEU|nr:transglycosylase family protein [Pseudonocardia asaccharolytica]GEL20496.1 transglycosylase [Pseudonocardia asaccharolytica DSM 44247 = NBRC 16224]
MALLSKRNLVRLAVAGAVAVGAPVAVAGTANAAPANAWDQLAQCESGGKWNTNTGNGYAGGLQFSPSTWRAYGGTGSPQNASRDQQIAVAERVLAGQGWGAWPACSKKLGLSGTPAKQKAVAQPAKQSAAKPVAKKQAATKQVTKKPVTKKQAQTRAAGGSTHTVAAGDTLSKIAAANGTTWQALYAKNHGALSNPNMILVGQVLQVG